LRGLSFWFFYWVMGMGAFIIKRDDDDKTFSAACFNL